MRKRKEAKVSALLSLPEFRLPSENRIELRTILAPDGTPEPATVTAYRVRAGLDHLLAGVVRHDVKATEAAIMLLRDGAHALVDVLLQEREFARTFTRRSFTLPIPMGRNSDLRQHADEVLERLEVGADVPANVVQAATGRRGNVAGVRVATPAVRLSLDLYRHLEHVRAEVAAAESVAAVARAHGIATDDCRAGLTATEREIVALPPFDRMSARQWADAGIAVLESRCGAGRLSARPELAALLPAGFARYEKTTKAKRAAARYAEAMQEWHGRPYLSKPHRKAQADTIRNDREQEIRRRIRESFSRLAARPAG